jgi:DNA invertase Pin-like site-specific DNA recombinase
MAVNHKAAIYARVNTDEQIADPQLRDLREYAANRGWWDVQEFVDVGVSGAKDSRPAWNQLWDALQKGKVKVLLAHALDRLGRSLPHLVKILSTLVKWDVVLVSFRENIDVSTSTGRMVAGLFNVLTDYELSIIRERTKAGMRAARARGSQIGPRKRLFDIERATRLRDQGWGQIRIARELGVGVGRVNKWVKEEYLQPERRTSRQLSGRVRRRRRLACGEEYVLAESGDPTKGL